jgi:hypothetical protein
MSHVHKYALPTSIDIATVRTACGKDAPKKDAAHLSYRWKGVTCPACLRSKPPEAGKEARATVSE